jgi:hypothetical protein
MELLGILDFVVSNFDYQTKKKKKSEMTYYRYAVLEMGSATIFIDLIQCNGTKKQ